MNETSDLLFLAAPPIGGFGGGRIAVRRQHEPPHRACYHVHVKHGVALAERQTDSGREIAEEDWI